MKWNTDCKKKKRKENEDALYVVRGNAEAEKMEGRAGSKTFHLELFL